MLLLPRFDWYRLYGTNFDRLVELAFSEADVPILVRRSNYDFSRSAPNGTLEYLKIHGCISEDVGFGDKGRMLLTEDDYDNFASFREASFRTLAADILTKDLLVVGQSLSDPHLKDEVKEALQLHAAAGTPGRVLILSYTRDLDRAQLLEDKGARVFFGDLDQLLNAMFEATPADERRDVVEDGAFVRTLLPGELVGVTVDVHHAAGLESDVKRLFNGGPASFADIAAGFAFQRSVSARLLQDFEDRQPILVVLGAGGVGKTTLARQLVSEMAVNVDAAWEHNNSFPLQSAFWIEYEKRLQELGKRAVLLVDDCTENLAQVSLLCDHLGQQEASALQLILTANVGKWSMRSKSRYIFSHGRAVQLSRLTSGDLDALISLTMQKAAIRELVDSRFLTLSRSEQKRVLRERCAADMFVCMKNIFATEELDTILLREYADLNSDQRDVYRHVSALEALGARVHRQLIMRTLSIEAGAIASLLAGLDGVISEFDISAKNGIFGWETRHREVATVIARYKYADQTELLNLFERLVDSINPSVWIEVEAARALCSGDFGINRLSDPDKQLGVLRKVVELLPGEGIPRHRLIRKLIDGDRLDEATLALRQAIAAIGSNSVLDRYEVLLGIRKAMNTQGILDEDRLAMLLDAEGRAVRNIDRNRTDMHAYRTYGEVGSAIARIGGGTSGLENAISLTRKAEQSILDPKLAEYRRKMEADLRAIARAEA